MSSYAHPVQRAVPQAARQLVWFAVVCSFAFLVPYLGVSLLDMQQARRRRNTCVRVEDLRPTRDEGMTATLKTGQRAKPLLGIRRQPGRLALAVFRLPLPLYQRGWGWLLGRTFLLVTHAGRKTGKRRETVAMTLAYDPQTQEAVIFSGWGPNADWIRNIRAHPALQIQIGRASYTPEQRFLSEDESVAVVVEFRRQHRWRVRLAALILGWGDLSSDTAVRDFVRSHPFVSFRPARAAAP